MCTYTKKIGVITMYRKSYGGFLQAFALQQKLIEFGYQPELIRYDYYNDQSILEVPLSYSENKLYFAKRILVELYRHTERVKRTHAFEPSIKKHLRESETCYRTYSELKNNPPQYDIYLTGSDQVFNTNITPHANDSRLLLFAEGVKVSYAASAGSSQFTHKYAEKLCNALTDFNKVSVRESELKDFLQLQGVPAVVHVDPTLLLDKYIWHNFGINPVKSKKYILFYQVGYDKKLIEAANKLSTILKLPVFSADGFVKFPCQIEREHFLSPEEWVGAIDNAEYVVTNSFHGTAFTVLFNKKAFIIPPPQYAERIINLIKNCQLERLYNSEVIRDEEISCVYEKSSQFLNAERKKSFEYLKSLKNLVPLNEHEKKSNKDKIKINICGFDYSDLKAYSGYSLSNSDLLKSSSGGGISAIAEAIISNGGLVFGVSYSDNFYNAHYICVNNIDDIVKLRGSKYISTSKRIHYAGKDISLYVLLEEKLRDNTEVLFIGLGCDIAAVYSYLKGKNVDLTHLYTIDLICHGPTYPEVQEQYIKYLENKYHSIIVEFTTRYKKKGWTPPYIYARFKNGRVFMQPLYESDFGYAFNHYTKKACFNCKFKGLGHLADLTVGDYWGITSDMNGYNKNGVTIFISRTKKGETLINKIDKARFSLSVADVEFALENNRMFWLRRKINPDWEMFKKDFTSEGLHQAVIRSVGKRKYNLQKIKRLIKHFIT